ncbi:MAG TPA: hybrid sensor histidine kinase/response regulator, partial [Polyangiaceae bacterium]|nr:hybrid sensor histidine kinase/response regulator [Polyangiaceae bacterium]
MQIPASPKILVVDDTAENRALAKATLEDEGYRVLLAASGEEGVAKFEAEAPDCMLLDVRMPGMDGFAVCSRIRALPGGPDIPILFLTSARDVDTFDRALRAGGDDFLTKPVRPTELVIRVQAALKLRRMSAELREHYDLVRRQRDDLMRLQLQKERLTAFVVHDLKNPVNSMDLYAQVLLRDRELGKRARDSAQRIRDEARSLLRLLLNLLDISKSEEGRLVPERAEVDLEALVAEVLGAHDVNAQAVGVVLNRNVQVRSIPADVDLLRRVLENLLDNSLRHAPEGSEVVVSVTPGARAVEIRVADAGFGIPPELREKIFERFAQVETG